MKIKPVDVEKVTSLVSEFVLKHSHEIEAHASKVSPMRLRWDVLHKAVPHDVIKGIYEYANDAHIDTLLRKLFKHSK